MAYNIKWIIVNECGTRCFSSKSFKTYEDGWDFLYCQFPSTGGDVNEAMLDGFFVIKADTPHQEYVGGLFISF
jgi:hypothetical protein